MQKAEEHKRVGLKVEEGLRLALEARQIEEEEEHTWIEAEEEARLVEEERLKYEEEEEDLRRKAEDEARLAEDARLKVEEHECARLNLHEGVLLDLELRQRAEEE